MRRRSADRVEIRVGRGFWFTLDMVILIALTFPITVPIWLWIELVEKQRWKRWR